MVTEEDVRRERRELNRRILIERARRCGLTVFSANEEAAKRLIRGEKVSQIILDDFASPEGRHD